jgi:hypothetical protein
MVFTLCRIGVHRLTVQECVRAFTWTFMVDVQGGHHPSKLRRINEAIRGRADLPLIDELIESRARDAKLAGGFGFRESGHGQAS